MLRVQDLPEDGGSKSIGRFFHLEDVPRRHPFDAVFTIHWEPPNAMWIHGMGVINGRVTRKWLLELIELAESRKVEIIKSVRGEGHRIPYGIVQPNGDIWTFVRDVRTRFPSESAFAAL